MEDEGGGKRGDKREGSKRERENREETSREKGSGGGIDDEKNRKKWERRSASNWTARKGELGESEDGSSSPLMEMPLYEWDDDLPDDISQTKVDVADPTKASIIHFIFFFLTFSSYIDVGVSFR